MIVKETKLLKVLYLLFEVVGNLAKSFIIVFTGFSIILAIIHFNPPTQSPDLKKAVEDLDKVVLVVHKWQVLQIVVVQLILIYGIHRVFLLEKSQMLYANRTARYTAERLNTLSKIKLHDIRNNYNKISNLVAANKLDELRTFVDESAYYFSILLNNWERYNWTLKEEFDLLDAYLSAEKVLGLDAVIRVGRLVSGQGSFA